LVGALGLWIAACGGGANTAGGDGGSDASPSDGMVGDAASDGATGDGSTDAGTDGATDGSADGATDGSADGAMDGAMDGATDGAMDGSADGAMDGATDGAMDGATDGAMDGATDGAMDGATDASADSGAMDSGAMDSGAMDSGAMPECTLDSDCDDGLSCTADACAAGVCGHMPVHSACGDGLFCNGVEACAPSSALSDPVTGCVGGPAPDCDDGMSCTIDRCDEASDSCLNTADDSVCDDGLFCTGMEACAPAAPGHDARGCVAGPAATCDDAIPCTTDSCSATSDTCEHVASDAICDDGLFCDGNETCAPSAPGADAQGCAPGTPVVCDDTFACTDDVCDDAADACISTPIDTVCDDGFFCDGVEICDPSAGAADARGCAAGAAITCADDGLSCTLEACNEASDACTTTRDHASCAVDMVCTGAGAAPTGCEPGSTCTVDTDCDDMDACTGTETCSAGGICQPGTTLDCADAIGCTADTCDPVMGCDHTPDDAFCDNGVACDGVEICDSSLDCLAGTPLACNDSVSCTLDSCSEAIGGCVHVADDGLCDNSVFCDGAELCSPTLGCQAGTPPSCNDAISCTDDRCDGATDACMHVGVASRCDDGAFCNGVESCMVGMGCRPGTPVNCNDGVACSTDSCNETSDSCETVFDSSLCAMGEVCTMVGCTPGSACTAATASSCDDGLFCNGVETCSSTDSTPGVCQGGTAPNCNDGNACTVDACSGTLGACTHTPRDLDLDGYGDLACGGTDCNDSDPFIHPGADDPCDGVDNNCDGLVDGGLGSAGDLCSSGGACCSANCASGICVAPSGSCGSPLDSCSLGSDCCSGLCSASVDGVRRCQVPGGCGVAGTSCTVSADCCSTGCVGGVCSDTTTCTLTAVACSTDMECCSSYCGPSGACEAAGSGCEVDGDYCSSNGNCCSGFCMATAGGGRCSDHDTCRGEGQICTANGDCCNGGCDFAAHPEPGIGRCQVTGSCSTSGEACTSVRSCCSALCVDAGSGVGVCEHLDGCRPFGEICTASTDCCSDECGPPEGNSGLRRCVNPPGCVDAGEICAQGGSNNCCVLRSAGCSPTGLGVSRCNDTASCIPLDGMCDFAEQCCDGRQCLLDPSGVRRCLDGCVPVAGACLANSDCCVGSCIGGVCDDTPIGCIPVGSGTCATSADCCSGFCLGGICGSIGD